MKYYSEITKKMYDSYTDLTKAEAEATKAETEKAAAKASLDLKFEAVLDASEEYLEALDEYNKKYGVYKHEIDWRDFDTLYGSLMSGLFH